MSEPPGDPRSGDILVEKVNPPEPRGTIQMTVGPQVVAVVLLGIAIGSWGFGLATAASRILGWAVASAVIAALVEPLVTWLDRWVPRVVAILAGLLFVGLLAGSVITGILADLDNQFDRLRDQAPQAAEELEDSDRFGELARNFRLEDRVNEVLDRLHDPTSGLASEESASAASAYLVGAVLAAFFLASGPRTLEGGLNQIRDPGRRERAREIIGTGFLRGRTYVHYSLARAAVAGLLAWALCYWEEVPAPIVMGVAIAGLSVVPGFGIFFGGIFALLLEAGLGTPGGVARLAVAFMLMQIADAYVNRLIIGPRSLVVGPAAIVIAVIVGFEIYGIGGAIYAAILVIFAVAMLDAAGLHPATPEEAAEVDGVDQAGEVAEAARG